MKKNLQYATLGGGCFWCIEAIFKEIRGVISVSSGYSGGTIETPSYEQLHYEKTGHAEVIQIEFDPNVIDYGELLQIFFTVHDPTTPNRQGNDVGPEYRSIILYHDENQKKTAEDIIRTFAASAWEDRVVTELVEYKKFWSAEEYHQDFYAKNPESAYCQIIINPKLTKFKKQFAKKLKSN